MWSVTIWLIVLNVLVFVIDRLLGARWRYLPMATWGYFSAETAIQHLQLWRLITFQFLHASVGHLFFNMLSLYFFGPLVERYLGSRRFIVFYLLCGMAGAAAYLLMLNAGVLIGSPAVPLVGASAGIFGVLIAAARIAPQAYVMLLFPPIPMRLRTLAWVLLGLATFTVLSNGRNAGGEAAHLGGAALGALLIQFPQILNVVALRFWRPQWRRSYWREDLFG